jgi:zinc transport system substrate-binding protein
MGVRSVVLLMVAGVLVGCGGERIEKVAPMPEVDEPLLVAVVNYPLMYFAERIGGDQVRVLFPAPPDEDPAYWSPDAETIMAYQQADLILLNGAGYAKWVERATLPASRLVDTSAGIAERLIPLAEVVTHSHGPKGKHEHTGFAFTTWLDPDLAAAQAQAVAEALVRLRPDEEDRFRAALAGLEADLGDMDRRLAAAATKLGDAPLLFSHPVYQYLKRKYGLNGVSVHREPGEPPNMDELRRLLDQHPAQWMVWEGEPLAESKAQLEAVGVGSVVYDPCGDRPVEGDFLSVMEKNTASFG